MAKNCVIGGFSEIFLRIGFSFSKNAFFENDLRNFHMKFEILRVQKTPTGDPRTFY